MLLGWLSPLYASSQSLLLSLICLVFEIKLCVCVSLLSIQILRLCVCYGADFVMEKGKSESSERSFGESDSVVSSQSDIQVKNHLTN